MEKISETLAALALKKNVNIHEVDYQVLKEQLLKDDQVLSY
ncbi:FAD-dependent oxidoreductase [Tamlana sp. 62-3]|uniref:FAD-dependent oxidoreductase n=1 Tax=Neotamlana sargassicola TaxID=2883125 RepID=A0A9X1I4W9_9FLAO|nr:FAD-dependent oxidoreductase [Tamlana sargassicola]MCB4807915.1 FAD-dependent oxidoreductase [Tamlana sargassicola]